MRVPQGPPQAWYNEEGRLPILLGIPGSPASAPSHINNGHVLARGEECKESPIKGGAVQSSADGGFCCAYHEKDR